MLAATVVDSEPKLRLTGSSVVDVYFEGASGILPSKVTEPPIFSKGKGGGRHSFKAKGG